MFFRRQRVKVPTFHDRLDALRAAGFTIEPIPEQRVRVTGKGVSAVIADTGQERPAVERAGVLVGDEIAIPLNGGYQMFLETPSGRRLPATAPELKAIHEFEEDLKEALGLTSLYNTSLGSISRKHLYDRVTARDQGRQPRPWLGRHTS